MNVRKAPKVAVSENDTDSSLRELVGEPVVARVLRPASR